MTESARVPSSVATIDFHVTSECGQECPYCWGPQEYEHPVDTGTALRIVEKVKAVGASRIVFTGGDPATRADLPDLVRHARRTGLEVALSTTGDALTCEMLARLAPELDLISLPLDGPSEEVSARTKQAGHFAAVLRVLDWLRAYPAVDVKLCTPVTRHNLAAVAGILRLVEDYAATTNARVFYNVFQAFPRAMFDVEWDGLLVSPEEFAGLKEVVAAAAVRVNLLDHATLDRLYVMIFPDGSLTVPAGPAFANFGPFLEVEDLHAVLNRAAFDSARHLLHSKAWRKEATR